MKIIKFTFLVILTIALIVLVYLWIKSPGATPACIDKNGQIIKNSIAEIVKLKIGGVDQYLTIRGEDKDKPVLLFLHGGPGSPAIATMKSPELDLQKDFVLVYWEQRGSGKSYHKDLDPNSLSLNQLISDVQEISNYLKSRFDEEKIYLMGHSWGSFLGVEIVNKHPELFHALITIGQVVAQYEGEQISTEWVKSQAKLKGDQDLIDQVSKIVLPDSLARAKVWLDYLNQERKYVNQFGGGLSRKPVNAFNYFANLLINHTPEYTISDKLNFTKGVDLSMEKLWPVVMQTNLNESIDSLKIPIHILQGRYDYQTPHDLAYEFYEQLKAPNKSFTTFENSAHSPFRDETALFNKVVRKLAGLNTLNQPAD